MSRTLEQFSADLVSSRLLGADELAALYANQAPADRPETAEALAELLVARRKLTKFQALKLLEGDAKSLLLGEYIVLDKLGQGGMGVVYKAQHRRMKRIVALKVLPSSMLASGDSVQRFYREAEAAARLAHPHIVTAYDAGEAAGVHYLAMEYVDGLDLAQLMQQRGPLPLADALDFTLQAAEGLKYAHEQGVVHRDMKPGNLLLDRQGVVKILDMGLARLNETGLGGSDDTPQLTQTGQLMGTVDYMSPEQAEDTRRADHRSDIYAVGCTLYRFLTNEAPYGGDTLMKRLLAHRDHPIPSLCIRRPDVPPRLDALFQRMLAKRPEQRVQTMAEVVRELTDIVQHCSGALFTAAPILAPRSHADGQITQREVLTAGAIAAAPAVVREDTLSPRHEFDTGRPGRSPLPLSGKYGRSRGRPWWMWAAVVVLTAAGGGVAALWLKPYLGQAKTPIARQPDAPVSIPVPPEKTVLPPEKPVEKTPEKPVEPPPTPAVVTPPEVKPADDPRLARVNPPQPPPEAVPPIDPVATITPPVESPPSSPEKKPEPPSPMPVNPTPAPTVVATNVPPVKPELPPTPKPEEEGWVNLFEKRDASGGLANDRMLERDGELTLAEPRGQAVSIEFRVSVPDNYDLELEFTPRGLQDRFLVIALRVGGQSTDLTCEATQMQLRHRVQKLPYTHAYAFKSGRRETLKIEVRNRDGKAGVRVLLGGQEAIRWTGSPADLAFGRTLFPTGDLLGLGTMRDTLQVHKCRLREVK